MDMTGIIVSAVSALIILGSFVLMKRLAISSTGGEMALIEAEVTEIEKKLAELIQVSAAYGSPKQLEFFETHLASEASALEQEKGKLKEVEAKLDAAQKNVEGKEAHQQELKTAKEEDENKLRDLLANYQTLSDESIALEKRLAASMKSLESIIAESSVSDEQKQVLNDLLTTVTDASSRLRELLTEYQLVNERLSMLNQQFADLEEEYTKLVEQQLGE